MIKLEPGMLAKSLAGHDRKKIYIIIKIEAEYVWVADGRCHLVESPKKKNRKHIQPICRIPTIISQILENGQTLHNEHIIQAIQSEDQKQTGGYKCQRQM